MNMYNDGVDIDIEEWALNPKRLDNHDNLLVFLSNKKNRISSLMRTKPTKPELFRSRTRLEPGHVILPPVGTGSRDPAPWPTTMRNTK
jgi:hypothetical protein